MNEDDDRKLAAAFSALRREEQENFPPFADVVRRARARSRRSESPRPRLLWAAAAVIVLAVLAAWLGLRTPAPQRTAGEAPSLAEWRSPTDFLLATSGQEILAAPAGWSRSVLDLEPSPQPSERRSTS